MSLYGRLFTYRGREKRNPLEDFLSESLADLLTRMPINTAREIVAVILGGTPEIVAALSAIWPDQAKATWSTQYPIVGATTRYVDIVLEIDGVPALAIENKIGAGFQDDQLPSYSRWIAGAASRNWGGATVLLTHTTPVPTDFGDAAAGYASSHHSVVRWSTLARLLGSFAKGETDEVHWRSLARELYLFLEEQNMVTEFMTAQDLASLQLYIGSSGRLHDTLWALWEPVQETLTIVTKGHNYGPLYYPILGCLEIKRYMKAAEYGWSWVSVGLRFPGNNPSLYPEVGQGLAQAYISVSAETSRPSMGERLSMPADWKAFDSDWIAVFDIDSLIDPHEFTERAKVWMAQRAAELRDQIVAEGLG